MSIIVFLVMLWNNSFLLKVTQWLWVVGELYYRWVYNATHEFWIDKTNIVISYIYKMTKTPSCLFGFYNNSEKIDKFSRRRKLVWLKYLLKLFRPLQLIFWHFSGTYPNWMQQQNIQCLPYLEGNHCPATGKGNDMRDGGAKSVMLDSWVISCQHWMVPATNKPVGTRLLP